MKIVGRIMTIIGCFWLYKETGGVSIEYFAIAFLLMFGGMLTVDKN